MPVRDRERTFAEFYGVSSLPEDIKPINISLMYTKQDLPSKFTKNQSQNQTDFLLFPHVAAIENKCMSVPDSKSVFFVKTARDVIVERFKIRRYFRSSSNLPVKNYFFVLGTDTNGSAIGTSRYLRKELDEYKDIVIADFVDTYNNLPLKTKVTISDTVMPRELTLEIDFFSSGHFGTKLLWSIGFDPRVLKIYPIPTLCIQI